MANSLIRSKDEERGGPRDCVEVGLRRSEMGLASAGLAIFEVFIWSLVTEEI